MRSILLGAAALSILSSHSVAQTVVEDAKGQSALLLPVGGYIGINTGEKSVELGWYRNSSTSRFMPGATLQASAKDGLGTLFAEGAVQPGVRAEAILGYKITGQTFIGAKYSRGWHETAIATPTEDKVVDKELVWTWQLSGHLTSMFHDRIGAGASVQREKTNNYEDLKKVSLTTIRKHMRGDGTEVEIRGTTEAREGSVAEGHTSWINADVVLIPFSDLPRVVIRPFGRGVISRDSTARSRSSFGLDVGLHDGDVIHGRTIALVVQISEILPGDAEEDRELDDRLRVSIVTDVQRLAELVASVVRN
jgi:hypothetical protein